MGMTNPFKTFAFLVAMGLLVSPLHAQDDAGTIAESTATEAADTDSDDKKADKKKEKKAGKARTKVGQALEELDYLSEATPNPKAKNFIFLFSASWCKYCPPVMELMVKEYPKMKKKGVEVILMSPDQEESVKKYVEKYRAEFPAIRYAADAVKDIPGSPKPDGLPGIMVVNGKGDVLFEGNGSHAKNWENLLKKKPDKKKAKKSKK